MENVTVRSFRVSAPTVWDNLLEHLRNYHMQKKSLVRERRSCFRVLENVCLKTINK